MKAFKYLSFISRSLRKNTSNYSFVYTSISLIKNNHLERKTKKIIPYFYQRMRGIPPL